MLKTYICNDSFNEAFKTVKSYIDTKSGTIFLRAWDYPTAKNSMEYIVSDDSLVVNWVKKRGGGISSETIFFVQISNLVLKMSGYSGSLEIEGKNPKKFYRMVHFNLVDFLTALAAATHIVEKRQGDTQNPLKAKIDPDLIEMRRELDAGEIEEEGFRILEEKGVFAAIGYTGPGPKSASGTPSAAPTPEAPVPEVSASSTPPVQSVADELLKLNNLVNMGVLTQEEFDHKKKILLGL